MGRLMFLKPKIRDCGTISNMSRLSNHFWVVVPVFISIVLFSFNLSRLPLEDADEATYAIVLREMVKTGHYLTPTYFQETWVNKPPLHFWLMVGDAKIFGLNEFAMRLPGALAGVLAVFFTALIIFQLTKRKTASALGGLLLATMPLFLAGARNLRMDVTLTACILGALLFFLKGRENKKWFLGFGLSLALGFLIKGVLIFLVLPIIFFYAIIYRERRWLKNFHFWLGNILGFIIGASWIIYEYLLLGSFFLSKYFGFQIFRLGKNVIDSRISVGYLLWVFWKYGQPLSFLFIIGVISFLSSKLKNRKPAQSDIFRPGIFFLISFLFIFAVFLISTTRLVPYLIPSYPFLTMFLASTYGVYESKNSLKNPLRILAILVLIIAVFFSLREAFWDSRLYVSAFSWDEKTIGLALKNALKIIPVYLYEYPNDQTIDFYAERRVTYLNEENSSFLVPPFYLVLPTPLIKENDWLKNFPPLYKGDNLALIKVLK